MDTIYNVVWNSTTGTWVVASEMAKGRKKKSKAASAATAAMLVTATGLGAGAMLMPGAAMATSGLCTMRDGYFYGLDGQVGLTATHCAAEWGYNWPGGEDPRFNYTFLSGGAASSQQVSTMWLDGGRGTINFDIGAMGGQVIRFNPNGQMDGLTDGDIFAGSTDAVTGNQLFALQSKVEQIGSGGGTAKYFHANSTAADSSATGGEAIAIGPVAKGTGYNSIALGNSATAGGQSGIAIGSGAVTEADWTFAAGNAAAAKASGDTALGASAQASGGGQWATALGTQAKATATKSTAVGGGAQATHHYSAAIGSESTTDRINSVSVGNASWQRQVTFVAKGTQGTDAVNVDQLKGVTTALGGGAGVDATTGAVKAPAYNVAGGSYTNVGAALAAVDAKAGSGGGSSKYFHTNTTLADSVTTGADSIAIGGNAASDGKWSLAAGTNAKATADNSVALGNSSLADRANSVSVGSATVQRQIINVAKGTLDTDAVNVDQLKSAGFTLDTAGSVTNAAVTYKAGSIAAGSPMVVLDKGTGDSKYFIDGDRAKGKLPKGTVISNVADGTQDTDAANRGSVYDIVAEQTGNGGAMRGLLVPLVAGVGSGVDTTGLTASYKTAAYYSQVAGKGDSAGSTPPSDMARASGAGSIAVGSNAFANATSATAVGVQAYAAPTATDAVALGAGSVATEANTVSLGSDGKGSYTAYDALGAPYTIQNQANTRRLVNMAAGKADTDGVNVSQLKGVTTALGGGAGVNTDGTVKAPDYVVGGSTVHTVGDAINNIDGRVTNVTNTVNNITNGGGVKYFHSKSTLADSTATGNNSVAVGGAANATGISAIAIGSTASAAADWTFAAGNASAAKSAGDTALGASAQADGAGTYSTALGTNAQALATKATAVGAGAKATHHFSVALGQDSTTDRINSVSVGNASWQRQVTFVAKGTADTDAVNVSQLKGVTAAIGGGAAVKSDGSIDPGFTIGSTKYASVAEAVAAVDAKTSTGNPLGVAYDDTTKTKVTLNKGGTTGPVTIANLKAGVANDEAVNVAQLKGTANSVAIALGGSSTVNADGTIKAPEYTVAGTKVTGVGAAIDGLNTATGQNTTNITNLLSGKAGLVQQAGAGQKLTVGKDTDGTEVDMSAKLGATRQLTGVAKGLTDNAALTVAQLKSAGFTIDGTGNVANPAVTYKVGSIASGSPMVALDKGTGDSAYFVDGDRTKGKLPKGTVLSNVASGTQDTDAANIGTVWDIVGQLGANAPATRMLVPLVAGVGSGVDTTGLTLSYKTAAYYSQVAGKGDSAGSTPPSDVARASGAGSIAVGSNAFANATSATAVGVQAYAAPTATDAVALGAGSVATEANTVSLGSDGTGEYFAFDALGAKYTIKNQANTRRLVNLAAGKADTDGVNVSQLKGVTAAIGGGTSVNPDGTIHPGVTINGQDYGTVAEAITAVDTKAGTGSALGVAYDDATKTKVTLNNGGTTGPVTITNLKNGIASADAINMGQLKPVIDGLGGGAKVDPTTGVVTGPTYNITKVDGTTTTVNNVGDAITNIDGRVTNIIGGKAGLVQQAAAGEDLTVGKDTDGVGVNFAGTAGVRLLRGVSAGKADTDAVNVSQLKGVTAAIGGGAAVKPDGSIDPGFTIGGTKYASVAEAVAAVDAKTGTGNALGVAYDDTTKTKVTLNKGGTTGPVTIANVKDGVANDEAVNVAQLKATGIIDPTGKALDAVVYDANSNKASVSFGGATGTVLRNVAAGVVSSTSKEAINGSQLYGASQSVAGIIGGGVTVDKDGKVTAPAGGIAVGSGKYDDLASALNGLDGKIGTGNPLGVAYDDTTKTKVTLNNGGTTGPVTITNVKNGIAPADAINLGQLKPVIDGLGGGATVDPTTGVVTGPTYNITKIDGTTTTVHTVGDAITNIDGRTTQNTTNITNVLSGKAGLVQQAAAGDKLTVGKDTDGTEVNFTGKAGDRKLSGVAKGTADNDAVNVKQLKDAGLVDGNGNVANAVTYDSAAKDSVTLGNAGKAVTLKNVANATKDDEAINLGQLRSTGLVGENGKVLDAVVYDAGSNKASVTFGGINGTVLNNVADGRIEAGSRQAINGGQIAAIKSALEGKITNIDNRVTTIEQHGGGGGGNPAYVTANGIGGSPKPANAGDSAGVAVGFDTNASGLGASAIGDHATAAGIDSVAIGNNASTNATGANSVALGNGSVADRANTVSVGSEGHERTISNVARGSRETDAVNVGLLDERVRDLGTSANAYTDKMVNDVWSNLKEEIDHSNRQANRGIAAASALINVTPYIPGHVTVNAGVAGYRGESALGVGVSRWSENGRINLNAGVSAAQGDEPVYRVGIGYIF